MSAISVVKDEVELTLLNKKTAIFFAGQVGLALQLRYIFSCQSAIWNASLTR
jgi:hypothetical protein